MKLKDITSIVATVAPTLATALGGPLAGVATKAIAKAILGRDVASDDEVAQAIAGATPETLLALKKAEADFAVQMETLQVDLERIHAGDRDSARKREIETRDKIPAILGVLTLVSFFGYIGAVTFFPLEILKNEFINLALGWLGGTASTVVSYYFGSSAGRDRAGAKA